MAVPAVIARGVPAGAAIPRAFKSTFSLSVLPTFSMWEFEITPGKLIGGPPINFSSFLNMKFHTQLPQILIKQDPFTIKGKYDSDVWKDTQLRTIINQPGTCTFLVSNLGTLSNFCWVREVTFGTYKIDDTTPPTIELLVEIMSWDYINHVEAGWSYVDGYTGTADT